MKNWIDEVLQKINCDDCKTIINIEYEKTYYKGYGDSGYHAANLTCMLFLVRYKHLCNKGKSLIVKIVCEKCNHTFIKGEHEDVKNFVWKNSFNDHVCKGIKTNPTLYSCINCGKPTYGLYCSPCWGLTSYECKCTCVVDGFSKCKVHNT